MEHKYVTPETHNCNVDTYCPICDGGLSVCSVCGGAEGSLTSDCCGEMLGFEKLQEVYQGKVDFQDGEWTELISVHSPAYYRAIEE